jgi:hypothetical protein
MVLSNLMKNVSFRILGEKVVCRNQGITNMKSKLDAKETSRSTADQAAVGNPRQNL